VEFADGAVSRLLGGNGIKALKYTKTYNNEWFRVKRPIWNMACCDCGLVHAVRFHVSGRKIFMAVIRDNRATAAKRRKKQRFTQETGVDHERHD
jgi:hypothetical protein